jgi:2-oxoisovalerate dehydrogenase E1 component
MRKGDAFSTVHRDLGAVLAHYLDVPGLFPANFDASDRTPWDKDRGDPVQWLYRLACQLLGKRDGFTQGVDRSFHYGLFLEDEGIRHLGMISHLGSMLPVAVGLALASVQDNAGATVLAFIGEGATSQGDFHEALNAAAVLKLPFVLVIENNQYAFSTPTHEQFVCRSLADRAIGYGIAGEQVEGGDTAAVHGVMARAFARARAGEGPTLIEAMLPRMRGHAEGDGSYEVIPEAERAKWLEQDPMPRLERAAIESGAVDAAWIERAGQRAKELVEQAFEGAMACAEPDIAEATRSMYAPGEAADAFASRRAQ